MSLEYAILGFLNYKPLSGYDLKKVFDTTVQHFWPADQSQIYRTLSRLTDKDWVKQEVVEQNDRPDRKVYHITDQGRKELHDWLVGPFTKDDSRNPSLIKIFFAGQLSDEEILAIFKEAAGYMRAVQELYNNLGSQIKAFSQLADSEREMFFWMQTLELGKKTIKANVDWAEGVIDEIDHKSIPKKK
jgi:PadR family transcriptional regulator, regulatory protein AphA